MSDLLRDSIHGLSGALPLIPGETLLNTWVTDRASYWRSHAIMALIGGITAGIVLVYLGNPTPWVGPVAAAGALGVRGAYLASEALALTWRLTDRRLLGPGGRNVALPQITTARPFLGDVQIITRSGDKHLMKYMTDAKPVIAAIDAARKGFP
ncbi:MAG: hypothetical protein U1D35_08315 [Paracoccaceae bacterium]|nr:hypothetical protein [Paracoccaceae bacterium]